MRLCDIHEWRMFLQNRFFFFSILRACESFLDKSAILRTLLKWPVVRWRDMYLLINCSLVASDLLMLTVCKMATSTCRHTLAVCSFTSGAGSLLLNLILHLCPSLTSEKFCVIKHGGVTHSGSAIVVSRKIIAESNQLSSALTAEWSSAASQLF